MFLFIKFDNLIDILYSDFFKRLFNYLSIYLRTNIYLTINLADQLTDLFISLSI